MACAARCACSPRTVNFEPRRAMVTSSADSIWRRFSSSDPHSRARRWLSSGSSRTSTGLLRIQQFAAQRMRKSAGDLHFDERMNESRGPGEVYYAVVSRPAAHFRFSLFRETLYEHALRRADHRFADRTRLRLQLRLEALQPLQLHVPRGWVGQLRRGRAGPRAVEEGKGGIEADVAGQLQGGFEIAVGLAREADDEVGGKADSGARVLQPASDRAVLERGVAALHGGEHAVGSRLHRQVDVRRKLRQLGVRVYQPLCELARMRGGIADVLQGELADVMQKLREIGPRAVGRAAPGIHVLAEQRHLLYPLGGHGRD